MLNFRENLNKIEEENIQTMEIIKKADYILSPFLDKKKEFQKLKKRLEKPLFLCI